MKGLIKRSEVISLTLSKNKEWLVLKVNKTRVFVFFSLCFGGLLPCAALAQITWSSGSDEAAGYALYPAPSGSHRHSRSNGAFNDMEGRSTWVPLFDARISPDLAPVRFLFLPYQRLGVIGHTDAVFSLYRDSRWNQINDDTKKTLAQVRAAAGDKPALAHLPWLVDQPIQPEIPDRYGHRFIYAPMLSGRGARITLSPDYLNSVSDIAHVISILFTASALKEAGHSPEWVMSYLMSARSILVRSEAVRAREGYTFFDKVAVADAFDMPSGLPGERDIKSILNRVILAHESCHHYLGHTHPQLRAEREKAGVTRSQLELEADACAITLEMRIAAASENELSQVELVEMVAYLMSEYASITTPIQDFSGSHERPIERYRQLLGYLRDELGLIFKPESENMFFHWLEVFTSIQLYQHNDEFGLNFSGKSVLRDGGAFGKVTLTRLEGLIQRGYWDTLDYIQYPTYDIEESEIRRARMQVSQARNWVRLAHNGGSAARAKNALVLLREAESKLPVETNTRLLAEMHLAKALAHLRLNELGSRTNDSASTDHRMEARTSAATACKLIKCNKPASSRLAPYYQSLRDDIADAYQGNWEALRKELGATAPYGR